MADLRERCIGAGSVLLRPLPSYAMNDSAQLGDRNMIEFFNSPEGKAAKLPFSQSVRVGDVVYLSGALGNVPGKMELVPGGMEAETKQMMENIAAALKLHGLGFDSIFKCLVMLADMGEWGAFNKVYLPCFHPERMPARSAFGANGLALGARVEMECWAFAGAK
jgi:reactive intermediate/imine deaminase